MTIVIGGATTIATGGEYQLVPGQVTLAVVNDGDGDAVTCTLGGDTGAQNYVLYRLTTATTWTAGGDRAGDGDVAVAGLDNRTWYEFCAYSVQEGSYGQYSGITTLQVSDGGTLATQTLTEASGGAEHEYHIRTLQADTWERHYKIRKLEWDDLKPAVADEYYDDSSQIVANVREGRTGGGNTDTTWMIVTFAEISNKGFTNDYAETRRVGDDQYHETFTVVYGIAKAVDSSGIPALASVLDGGSGVFDQICNDVKKDDQVYPGLWVITSTYSGSLIYA